MPSVCPWRRRRWLLLMVLLWSCAKPPSWVAAPCCPGASLMITKFGQVDAPPDDATIVPGQRAIELFNPSCTPVALDEYELVMLDKQLRMQVSLSLGMRTETSGRGHSSPQLVRWLPASIPPGGTVTVCNSPATAQMTAADLLSAPLESLTMLPRQLVTSMYTNCSGRHSDLGQTGENGAIALVRGQVSPMPFREVVDTVEDLPGVEDFWSTQKCSLAAVRLGPYQLGNPVFNSTEWARLYGKKCPHPTSLTTSTVLAYANISSRASCVTGDNLLWKDPLHTAYTCADWRFYDCLRARIDYAYTPEATQQLFSNCPHACEFCAGFGKHIRPSRAELSYNFAPVDRFCANGTGATIDTYAQRFFLRHPPPPPPSSSGPAHCCANSFPVISKFTQLGAQGFLQRTLEIFNPTCNPALFADYELVFTPQYCTTSNIVVALDSSATTDISITKGGILVMCTDFKGAVGNPPPSNAFRYIEEAIGNIPQVLVESAWTGCTGNMSTLPLGLAFSSVSLRRSVDGHVVDTLAVDAPELTVSPSESDQACSLACVRNLTRVGNSPLFNQSQWLDEIFGNGCTGRSATTNAPENVAGFGTRSDAYAAMIGRQCLPTVPPVAPSAQASRDCSGATPDWCCPPRNGLSGTLMITKFLQLDVPWPEIGHYQQRSLEIYNPTCSSIKLKDYELVFLDAAKHVTGTIPLEPSATGNRPQTLGPGALQVICLNVAMGIKDPVFSDNEDLMAVSDTANLPVTLVDTSATNCDYAPGTAAAPALGGPLLYDTLVLRSTRQDNQVVDELRDIPRLNVSAADVAKGDLACSLAKVRQPRIRSNQPVYNDSDWVEIIGDNCPKERTVLTGYEAFTKYFFFEFGTRMRLDSLLQTIIPLNACVDRPGVPSDQFGIVATPEPGPSPPIPPPTPPTPGPPRHHQGGAEGGNFSREHPTLSPSPPAPAPAPGSDLLVFIGTLVLVTCLAVLSCCACLWYRQKLAKQSGHSMGLLTAQIGPLSFNLNTGDTFPAPAAVPDFQLTFRAGELREQITREVLGGGRNVTPWGGAFIMDDPDVAFEGKVAVGKGSYGTVYRATYQGHAVAVKEIEIDFSPTSARGNDSAATALREFQSELRVWCKLLHPCVVQFYGYTTQPQVCIVQEFIDGGSLYELLVSDVWLDTSHQMQFASDTAQGMAYLHSLTPAIIHRDLKSLNLLVANIGQGARMIKITDFGLARSKETMMGETAKMTQVGTPYWTAPEIFDDDVYNETADVYSFGMVLYEIWARQLPWQGLQPVQVALKVVNERVRPETPSEMTPAASSLMKRCWAHEPSERPLFPAIVAELNQVAREFARPQSMRLSTAAPLISSNPLVDSRSEYQTDAPKSSFGMGARDAERIVVDAEVDGVHRQVALRADVVLGTDIAELLREFGAQLGRTPDELMLFDVDFDEYFILEDMQALHESQEGSPTALRFRLRSSA
jgi:serine/threonine protein kinase